MRIFLTFVVLAACGGTGDQPGEGQTAGDCSDGADNDGDGAFDCDDMGCTNAPACDSVDAGVDATSTIDGNTPLWIAQPSGVSTFLAAVTGCGTRKWAVGEGGVALRSDNGGAWMPTSSTTTQDLHGIWCHTNPGFAPVAVAVGKAGTLIYQVGNTWQPRTSGTSEWLRGVWGSGTDDIFVVGHQGTVLHSTTSASLWGPVTTTFPSGLQFVGVFGRGRGDATLVGTELWKQLGATSFSKDTNPSGQFLSGIAGTNTGGGEMIAVGTNGAIIRYIFDWENVSSGTTQGLRAAWSEGLLSIAVGNGGTIVRSVDGGATWSVDASGTTMDLIGVWGNPNEIIAVGEAGTILRYVR
ncbi:MAG: hypothetical protein ACKV2T_07970 [Kofleriaceae bacterium]